MKCLICYQSKTGTTAKCAEILKKKLEKEGRRSRLPIWRPEGRSLPAMTALLQERPCVWVKSRKKQRLFWKRVGMSF